MLYFSVTGGFKAGGFNPASPAGSEAYDEEHTWNVEGGLKSAWAGRRVTANVSVFSIDWQDLQLNLPNTAGAGAVLHLERGPGAQQRRRVRAERPATATPRSSRTFGVTRARFGAGTTSSGQDVSDKKIPNTPDYTAAFGTDLAHRLSSAIRLYGRAEVVFYGAFKYDDTTSRGRTRIRSPTSGSACAARGCSRKAGCGTRSTRSTSRSRSSTTQARAVGVHRRKRTAADVRHHRRREFLSGDARQLPTPQLPIPNNSQLPTSIPGFWEFWELGVGS